MILIQGRFVIYDSHIILFDVNFDVPEKIFI